MINISEFNFKSEVINIIRLKCLIRDELKTINFFNVIKQETQIKLSQLHLIVNILQSL